MRAKYSHGVQESFPHQANPILKTCFFELKSGSCDTSLFEFIIFDGFQELLRQIRSNRSPESIIGVPAPCYKPTGFVYV